MTFKKWLETFVSEKGIDPEQAFSFVEGDQSHIMPIGTVIEFMINSIDPQTQAQMKTTIVKIDFVNGDVRDFFLHIAKGIARFYSPQF